jgi:hypothetical protein
MKQKPLAVLVAEAAPTAPMSFTTSAAADHDGIPEMRMLQRRD